MTPFVQETDMKTATALTAAIALLALSACGDETSTDTGSAGENRRVERSETPDRPVRIAEVEPEVIEEPEVVEEEEPVDAVIAFRGEDGELALDRKALKMVSPVHDAENDVWSVFVQLDKPAAEKFYTLTTKTHGEALSIVVDDMIVSAPVLENPVYGGGFVFDVDNGEAASAVVAALTGEEQNIAVAHEIAAEDALPDPADGDEAAEDVASVGDDEE